MCMGNGNMWVENHSFELRRSLSDHNRCKIRSLWIPFIPFVVNPTRRHHSVSNLSVTLSLFLSCAKEKAKKSAECLTCVSEWVHDDHNYSPDGSDDDHNHNYNDKTGITPAPRLKITDGDDVMNYDLLLSTIFSLLFAAPLNDSLSTL